MIYEVYIRGLPERVLAFLPESGLICLVNVSDAPAALPEHRQVLVSGAPLDGGKVPVDAAVRLST